MDTISPVDAFLKLRHVPPGSELFVSYLAGRPATPLAQQQAKRAEAEGISRHHFTGALSSLWFTSRGEVVFTLIVNERDNAAGTPGAYRTFNPNLGDLLALEVIELSSASPYTRSCPHCGKELRISTRHHFTGREQDLCRRVTAAQALLRTR
jgi:hypothetical protein